MEKLAFTDDGTCFEYEPLAAYVKKHKVHPVTKTPLADDGVHEMKLALNERGVPFCPIGSKEFLGHTHVVAIRPSGRVYWYDTVQEMNLKCKNWTDLVDGTPFKKKDIITLQDPNNLPKNHDPNVFPTITRVYDTPTDRGPEHALSGINVTASQKRIFAQLDTTRDLIDPPGASKRAKSGKTVPALSAAERKVWSSLPADAPRYAAIGLTCSAATPIRKDVKKVTRGEIDGKIFAAARRLTDGAALVRITTSAGDINAKLHCSLVPQTCYNFLKLAKQGYYNNTVFHRIVKNFIVQGGDPTATGSGGASCWGSPFPDEILGRLRHNAKGVLSMANSGPNSNGSQFFFTMQPAQHLDGKHTVFGQVIGQGDALDSIGDTPTNPTTEVPLKPVKLISVDVLQNPFEAIEREVEDAYDEGEQKLKKEEASQREREGNERRAWFSAPQSHEGATDSTAVGKYLKPTGDAPSSGEREAPRASAAAAALRVKKNTAFNMSNW
ncbi:Peptidyl-prolyl cis-trans isomerase-like 2 [Diplonema papillatum]|nr:Peptidyl-prolyl cis-trans isomerase-like 2 [Diplonema papillatum]WGM50021.1 PPIL2 [Diplonema papillatum]